MKIRDIDSDNTARLISIVLESRCFALLLLQNRLRFDPMFDFANYLPLTI